MAPLYCTIVLLCCAFIKGEYVSFDKLYEDGMIAYTKNDWKKSIDYIEQSLKAYKEYNHGISYCSIQCRNISKKSDVEEIGYLTILARKGLCVKNCLVERFGDFKGLRVSKEIVNDFKNLMPYQYLQFAYYQDDSISESVSSAYTYSLRFPDDELMGENMKYFRQSEDVTDDMFINRETMPHLELYGQAVEAYLKEDYTSSASLFEEALSEYIKAVDVCYGVCESSDAADDEHWTVDFYRQNAYHYVDVLECSLKCIRDLSSEVSNHYYPNYLPVMLHYLQYCHYQLDNPAKSAEYMMSYLLFHPDDSEMKENLNFLAEDFDISNVKALVQMEDYYRKSNLEAGMLEYSWNYFGMKDKDTSLISYFRYEKSEKISVTKDDDIHDGNTPKEISDTKNDHVDDSNIPDEEEHKDDGYESMKEKTDDIMSKQAAELEHRIHAQKSDDVDISHLVGASRIGSRVVDSKHIVRIAEKGEIDPQSEGPLLYEGSYLLANSSMLKGDNRFAVDGISDKFQCQELMDLAVALGKAGDGYLGKESPHTDHERFEGVTVLDAALAVKSGNLPLSVAKLYYDISEKVRAQTQAYFKLPNLYFDYTHLVCRTAKADAPAERHDLSHPVHADNCLLNDNAECVKEPPAYIWRDYSAIVYLNGDFDGGEFIFADLTARRVLVDLKPKCGRMVSFSAGKDAFHGVKPVLRGRRCAIALWFTLSEKRREIRRDKAKEIIDELLVSSKDEL